MRHTIQLKMPKLFGKKKTRDGADVVTEIDLEDRESDISTALLVVTLLVVGLTVGYLVGFRAGVHKGGTNVIVIKD